MERNKEIGRTFYQEKALMAALDSARICGECGVCCTGVFFSNVKLDTEDVSAILSHGGTVIERHDGKVALNHPCSFQLEGLCTIYDSRPRRCRDYHCKLTRSMMNGSVSIEQAQHIVHQLKELAGQLKSLTPDVVAEDSCDNDTRHLNHAIAKRYSDAIRAGKTLTSKERAYLETGMSLLMHIDRYFQETGRLEEFAAVLCAIARLEA